MPYLNQNDEEELKKQQEASGGTNISGQSTVINGAGGTPAKNTEKSSGSYTNLNQYLDANKENAEGMGTKIAGDITQQGSTARQGVQDTSSDFRSLADQGTLQGLDTAASEASDITNKARTSSLDNQINDVQVNRFKDISNAQYKGPQGLEGSSKYQGASQNIQKAQEMQQNAQTDEGRFNLLQNAYARPDYSQGQKKLDNLLVTGNQQAKANIQNAATSLSDIPGLWEAAHGTAADLASQRTAQSNAVRTGAQQGLLSGRTSRAGEIDSRLAGVQGQWTGEYDRLNNMLSGYQGGDLELTQADVDKLGLTGTGQGIYNTLKDAPASSYMDLKAFDASKVVNKDEVAQLNALDRLAQQFGGPATARYTDVNQAGTLGLDNNLDATRFGQAARAAEAGFQDYARNTNVSGTGSNAQSWYNGLGGTNKHWENASTNINANLKDYLDTGNFSIDGRSVTSGQNQGITVPSAPVAGIPATQGPNGQHDGEGFAPGGGAAPGSTPKDPFSSIIGSGVSLINDALFGNMFGGGGKQEEARRAAKETSGYLANQNYMQNLQNLLNQQGYANRVKVK